MAEKKGKYEVKNNDFEITGWKLQVVIDVKLIVDLTVKYCGLKLRWPLVIALILVLAASAGIFFVACLAMDQDAVICHLLQIKWRSLQLMWRL